MTPLEKSGYGMVRENKVRTFDNVPSMRSLENSGYGLVHDNGNWRGAKTELKIALGALGSIVFAGVVIVLVFGAN